MAPLAAITGNDASEIIVKAPVGSGKTTLLEVLACYTVAEKPGPALFVSQTEGDSKDWFDSGLLPCLQGCDLIKPLWPKDRHKVTKGAILFPHMPLWVAGANLSSLQSKSCDLVVLDEAWMLKKSLLQEARRRTHDRFNSKVVLVSQGGSSGEDFENACEDAALYEFSFVCPSCSTRQPWRWGNLKWEGEESPHYQCQGSLGEGLCGHRWDDNPIDRRAMASSGEYVFISKGKAGHVCFTYNALAVWFIPWAKLRDEWNTANAAKKRGDLAPLKQFLQKRLAQAWTELEELEAVPINTGGYLLGTSEQWDLTILTVDVQKNNFWYVVRTWNRAGESRLLDRGQFLHFHEIEAKREQWNIHRKAVFLDSAYRVEEVKAALAKYGWLGLNGRGEDSFPVTDRRGNKFRRIYSVPVDYKTTEGLARVTNYSSAGAKDILQILKQGNGTLWEVPSDVGQQYLDSLNSEIKKQTAKGMSWVQIKDHNHYFDLEAMQIIGATMHKLYPLLTNQQDEEAA